VTKSIPRILFLDMEGTLLQKEYRLDDGLVAPSAWTALAERIGPECLAAENLTKISWHAGEYAGYLEWMRKTVDIHQQYGLTSKTFTELVNSVDFVPNVGSSLQGIHARGVVTAMVTGGFKALADRVQKQLRIHHVLAACEYFFHAHTGLIEHVNLLPADEEGKVDFMRLICREYGANARDCAFVGDGMNDVHLAKEVGFSVAFNAQPELRAVATVQVSQPQGAEDFAAVADVLESKWLSQHTPLG
jgi:phosphoserine phosphatase